VITVPSRVVEATLDTFQRCGTGRRECVAYWTGARGSGQVSQIVHPRHRSGPAGYQVDQNWVIEFFLGLSNEARQTLVQIHTHPGSWVGHSETDDRFVLVPSVGFHSIVVPNFGYGRDPESWGIWRLERDGNWSPARMDVEWILG
jgi:proteasome lid subunit RPN8/RPN11